MKFLRIFFLFFIVQIAKAQTFTPEQVREDMTVLKQKFEQFHPEMYAYISKENYQKLYDSLYQSASQPMTYLEAFHCISPLVIALQDGHTAVQHQVNVFGKKPKLVPIYVRKLQEHFYISYNCSKDSTLLRGTEIYAIDGVPMAELFQKMCSVVSADNYNQTSRMFYVQGDFPSYYFKYFGVKDSVKITFRRANQTEIQQKKIACLDGKEVGSTLTKRYKWAIRHNLELKIVDSLTKTATLDITSFLLSGKYFDLGNNKFKRILRQDFQKIKEKGIENLIIDVRGNGGGYIPNVARVLKYLSKTPFSLVDTLSFKKKAYFKVAPIETIFLPMFLWAGFPKKDGDSMLRVNTKTDSQKPETDLHFDGKVYFLINPGCYSATVFTLALAKDRGIGTYIGEQVGGATWGSHAVNWYEFKLPNTKIRVHSPLFRLKHKLRNTPENFFLQPDFTVGRNYEELLRNNDNLLNFTLNMIRASGK